MQRTITAICLALALTAGFAAQTEALTIEKRGVYAAGAFDESAAEIVAYDQFTKRVFVVNGHTDGIDILDVSDVKKPKKVGAIDLKLFGKSANSVAVKNGLVAVAVEAEDKQADGKIVFFDTRGGFIAEAPAGALPDMVKFSPDGNWALTANEGEPNDAYDRDPEGSITLVDLRQGPTMMVIHQLSFAKFNPMKDELKAKGVRISHPAATLAQDLEPEYIAVSPDSSTAFVSLQENNAVAVVDIAKAEITDILPLGLKDWQGRSWMLDASDKDGMVAFSPWPVHGCLMPDSIDAFTDRGVTYFITANEGDGREYGDYADEVRVKKAKLDPVAFPTADLLQDEAVLGRLKIIPDLSDTDGDGDMDRLVHFGGRSFSIFTAAGAMVYDSGDDFAVHTATYYRDWFNTSNDEHEFDGRSDDKGSEPEAIAVGVMGKRRLAFIGLERMGGIMVYDISEPTMPYMVDYIMDRDFSGDPKAGEAGDLGPEGIQFVPAYLSHTGNALLIVGSEVSGTTTLYELMD